MCSNLGMFNSPIRDIEDLFTVFVLALESEYSIHNEEGVLIGYDYDCDTDAGCSGK